MAKTAQKEVKKQAENRCECGGQLRWTLRANNNVFYFYCDKCQNFFDKQLNKKIFEEK